VSGGESADEDCLRVHVPKWGGSASKSDEVVA
jgi:hypothetical protein